MPFEADTLQYRMLAAAIVQWSVCHLEDFMQRKWKSAMGRDRVVADAILSMKWLFGESPDYKLTFRDVCEALGSDKNTLREALTERFRGERWDSLARMARVI